MKIIPIYTDQLTGQIWNIYRSTRTGTYTDQLTGYHILFISVFRKISSKKPRKIGISSKKVVAKAYFYELCTVKQSQGTA